jgi:RNA polymerase sigma-70 factor (ECF subfamily)
MHPIATSGLILIDTQAVSNALSDFDSVIRVYWPRVFRFVLASVRDHDVAQTLAQDCFFRAHQGRARFRGDASLQTWLMQIAVNLVRDHCRNRRLQFWKRATSEPIDGDGVRDWLADGEINPEQKILVKERVAAVWNAAAQLPERQRTVFLLRFVEDMDLLEIAAVTGLKEGSVKVHLFRALRRVRVEVGRLT